MSVHVSSYIWKNCQATIAQKLVLVKLADNCNDEGYAFPSVATIARECCMSERYVQKIIKQLIASGELNVDVQSGKKTPNGYTNVYYVVKYRHINGITATPSDLRATGEQSDTPNQQGVNNSTPLNSDGVNNSTPQGVNNSTPKPSVKPSLKETTPPTTPEPIGSETVKAPVTKSDELLPVVDNKLSKEEYDQYIELIHTELKAHRGQDMIYYHILRGTSKKHKAYSLTDNPLSLDEFRQYVKWYKQQRPNLSFPGQQKIASNIEEFRQTVQKRNPVTPVGKMQPAAPIETVRVDVEDMQALQQMIEEQRKKIKGEAA
jgi:hypothetical protein